MAAEVNDPATPVVNEALLALVKTGAPRVRPEASHAWAKRPVVAWICPVAYSSARSPPLVVEPVRLVLAATSVPVSRARLSTKVRPSAVLATEQP